MNFFKTLAMVELVGVGMACESIGADSKDTKPDLQKKIEESKKIFVNLPDATPFDSDPKLRALYLHEYQAGYINIVAELYLKPDFRFDFKKGVKEADFKASTQGWSHGTMKALKDHPEKLKITPAGVTPAVDITNFSGIYRKTDKGLYIESSKAGLDIQH